MGNINFNIQEFKIIFNKIVAIGINGLLHSRENYENYLIKFFNLIEFDDLQAAKSFKYILSDEFIKNTHKDVLHTIHIAFANFETNFVNLHQYKMQTIIINRNIARTYFADLINSFSDKGIKLHFTVVCNWLDKITEQYAIPN